MDTGVSIVGIGQLPVLRASQLSLRELGAEAVRLALADAGADRADALFVGNMLADELQGQKHIASLIADEAGLVGAEALQVRAATATGAAALRMAYLAVAGGQAEVAVALGVEKMSSDRPHVVSALAKALDAEREVRSGATLLSQNARLMQLYLDRYRLRITDFDGFALNAHANANHNPNALFHDRVVTAADVDASPVVSAPLRLHDAAPICDGAAAVVVTRTGQARAFTDRPVRMLGASVVTDRFRIEDRDDPLRLAAATRSVHEAFRRANVHRSDIGFFEVHDAFSIMSALILEATGFAEPGHGWRLAADGAIRPDGRLPISTMGGLKARGHPIGASAIYQTCEIVAQLTGRAGANQLADPRVALLQSVGGAGSTVLTHIFGV
ncbi:MAG: acetyl-CoA acetyltransferase [Actinobacteria bacterium HGW-Actinobacteria-5]|jgi:acetyl-CoA C-acetyltransferase|nr:MAG: acetyl-CoA acetyltransferase [Actinobacteria bacterium HGW-Actinobacteria-5]